LRFLPLTLLALLCACPPPAPRPDASVPESEDAGAPDAGKPDAGQRDAGPPDAGFVNVAISNWCESSARAQCYRDLRCLFLGPSNLAECIAKKSESCDQPAFTRAVREGRLQFLSAKAAECLNGYNAGSCEDAPAACEVVFGGLTPPDGGCILLDECNSDGFCYQYDDQCPHRCHAWAPLGERCDGFTTRCRPGEAFCGAPTDGGIGDRCFPLKGLGAECVEYDACRPELACVNSICVKRNAALHESCGQSQGYPYCGSENFCRQDLSSMMPPPGTCERRGGLGAVCAGSSCLPSLRCSSAFATGTCVVRAAFGEPCSAYNDCEENLFCSSVTSRCQRYPRDGGDCGNHGSFYECASAHFCSSDTPDAGYICRPKAALGEPCTYDGACLSNQCNLSQQPDGGFERVCELACSQKADGGF
jgi:hypothetical protein